MKKFFRIFVTAKAFRLNLLLYGIFILLSVFFGIFSISMLAPFLDLLFNSKALVDTSATAASGTDIKLMFYSYLQNVKAEYGSKKLLAVICVSIVIMIFLKNLFLYLSFYVLAPVRASISNNFAKTVYNKLLQLPIGFFTDQKKGDIMSRASNDVSELEMAVSGTLEAFFKEPITIIALLCALLFISPQLTLFVLIFLPLSGFVVARVGRTLKKQTNQAQVKWAEVLTQLEETLGGMRIIKAFNAEKKLKAAYYKLNDELFKIKVKMQLRRDLASPMSEFLGVCILIVVLWFGGNLVLENKLLSSGMFITYVALFSQIINPAKALSTTYYQMLRGVATLDRMDEILLMPNKIEEKKNAIPLAEFKDSIEFKNVSFSYQDKPILKNINLTVKKGETVALVGASGAGKSTMADLIPRFHDVSSGELLIDGINIKDYSLSSLRNKISIVTQEPILFNDTVANNIALGKENAAETEIRDAAMVANAWDFISKKEEGLQTNVGDRGSKLSGGERQRVTIARALIKNPPILILDEATSSLDTESERLVQDAINKMMHNRTAVVIAHRLSTIRNADQIIVLDQGEIVERGTHEQLLANNGRYKMLIAMQEVK